ncbi:hypothetical protein FA95DRAFT_1599583 [Auriscalpium vulgare]|uniref:Uncharacterized protein n=1 Tax=Auriscalpium vulgare TaxID=40419 RepID=A0ACB8R8X6_9AGAM|nr:hypothetical protein FA95DRAFT_1599583 [Auriscalpium vulgare]
MRKCRARERVARRERMGLRWPSKVARTGIWTSRQGGDLVCRSAGKAEVLEMRARVLLRVTHADRDLQAYLADSDQLLVEGSPITVYLEDFIKVEQLVPREQTTRTTRSRSAISRTTKHVEQLEGLQRVGQSWDEHTRHVLLQPYKKVEQLEEFANIESSIPIDPTLLDRIATYRTKTPQAHRPPSRPPHAVIGQFLSCELQPGNEYIPQVRHYMRKRFCLDLIRILAEQPVLYSAKKRRQPRFTFWQDIDQD